MSEALIEQVRNILARHEQIRIMAGYSPRPVESGDSRYFQFSVEARNHDRAYRDLLVALLEEMESLSPDAVTALQKFREACQ